VSTNTTHNRPFVGTIVWGVILLVVAGIAYLASVGDLRELSPSVIAWGVVGIGGLLVLAALVGVVARAVRPQDVAAAGVSAGGASAEGSSTGSTAGGSTTGPADS
jgi:hypothetical protein